MSRANVVRKSDVITRQYQTGVRFYDKSLWEEAEKQGYYAIKRMIDGALMGSSVTCILIGQDTWKRPWVRYEIIKSVARGNGLLGVQIHDVGFDPRERDDSLAGGLSGLNPFEQAFMQPSPPLAPTGDFSRALAEIFGDPPSKGILTPRSSGLLNGDSPLADALARTVKRVPTTNPFSNALEDVFRSRPTAPPPQPGQNPFAELGYILDRAKRQVTFYEKNSAGQWVRFFKLTSENLDNVPLLQNRPQAGTFNTFLQVYGWKASGGSANFPMWVEAAATQAGR